MASEEFEILQSIYGEDIITIISSQQLEIHFHEFEFHIVVHLVPTYPIELPCVEFIDTRLSPKDKIQLEQQLEYFQKQADGDAFLFNWLEYIREKYSHIEIEQESKEPKPPELIVQVPLPPRPTIIHGEILTDRKSTFQGHVVPLEHVDQVTELYQWICEDRKLQKATHNIMAYRIGGAQDCDDDGESGAGIQLLHLLELMEVSNVLVVVSRWYGGILLGPIRFKHIKTAAKDAILSMPQRRDR